MISGDMDVVVLELWGWGGSGCYREKSLLTPTLYTFEKCSFFILSPGCPLLLCHYRWRRPELIASMQRISAGVKPETCYSYLCEHMCMHIWSNIRVYAYASMGVCTYVYICMHAVQMVGVALGKWQGSSIFVDQSQGQGSCSAPCSRWMEASDGSSLAGCSIPAGPHRPTVTSPHHHHLSSFLSPSIGTGPEHACPLGSILYCA